jgi:hypothetical protein
MNVKSEKQYFHALFDGELFKACPLLTAERFVDFCKKRGVNITVDRLLTWEKLGILYPIARIYRFDINHKIERVDPTNASKGYRDFGPLQEGEHWSGETKPELASFSFNRGIADSWRSEGFLWSPPSPEANAEYPINQEKHRHVAYYSRFQVLDVSCRVRELTWQVPIESASTLDRDEIAAVALKRHDRMVEFVNALQLRRNEDSSPVDLPIRAAWLCQLLSDRYFFKTQTDMRRITLSSSSDWHDWDWYEFCRKWNVEHIVQLLNLTKENSKALYEFLSHQWSHHDPNVEWNKLVRFVSVEKRRRLKDDAALGQSLFEMAEMTRMFHLEAFAEDLKEPYDATRQVIYAIPDIPLDKDPLRALEFVANDFEVNPKPRLVLFVEGQTEEIAIPILFEGFLGSTLSAYGIELSNLRGVNNAAGSKADGASALWRLVDYLHHHQTMAVVLMDREGNAVRNIEKGLGKAYSVHDTLRKVTRSDYIKLWKVCFEFDNFYDWELAEVLSVLAKSTITKAEIRQCREQSATAKQGVKLAKLADVYKEKTGRDLDKPEFGRRLVEFVFSDRSKRAPANRPIVKFLAKVAELSSKNHQPDRTDILEYNQLSGHLGALRPGAIQQRNKLEIAKRTSKKQKS